MARRAGKRHKSRNRGSKKTTQTSKPRVEAAPQPSPEPPAEDFFASNLTDFENMEVTFVPDELGGVTIIVGGFPQSYVHTADPALLPFEYMQHLSAIADVLPIGKITVTHVGGAGLSLARYIEFTRPGSPQIVFEPRADITEKVRAELPLPRGHRIRVREQLGEEGITALADASADFIVIDAFEGGRVPPVLVTTDFISHCARVLAPHGVIAWNMPDYPGLPFLARLLATARDAGLGYSALIASHDVLRGRRFGNVVAAMSPTPLPENELQRRIHRCVFPTAMRTQHETSNLANSAKPIKAGEIPETPEPPTPLILRTV